MKPPRLMRPLGLAVFFSFTLTACAETELLAYATKRVQKSQTATAPAAGDYKVGKPYSIRGQWYYPAEDLEYSETGIASWYGQDFDGLRTANGEIYDMDMLTAAHPTLPMPSAVRVTNLENGRSIALRINDRGPFARGRIIDVSRRAADLLGFRRQGTAKVRVDIMADETRGLKLAALNSPQGRSQQLAVAASPRQEVVKEPLFGAPGSDNVLPASKTAAAIPRTTLAQPLLPTEVTVLPIETSEIFVQVGAFGDFGNALRLRDRLFDLGTTSISRVRTGEAEFYRVRLGPLNNVRSADALLAEVAEAGVSNAQLVVE